MRNMICESAKRNAFDSKNIVQEVEKGYQEEIHMF